MNMTFEDYFDMLNAELECDMTNIACEAAAIQAEIEFNRSDDYDDDGYGGSLESSGLALSLFEDDSSDIDGDTSGGNNYTVATEASFFAKIKSGFERLGNWFKRIGTGIKDWFDKVRAAIKRKVDQIAEKRKAMKNLKQDLSIAAMIQARDQKIKAIEDKITALNNKLAGSTVGSQTKKANKAIDAYNKDEANKNEEPLNKGEALKGTSQESIRRQIAAYREEIEKIKKNFDESAMKKGESIGKAAAGKFKKEMDILKGIMGSAEKANSSLTSVERKLLELGADDKSNSSLRNWSGIRSEREGAGDDMLGEKGIREKGINNGVDANGKKYGDDSAARSILSNKDNSGKLNQIRDSASSITKKVDELAVSATKAHDRMGEIFDEVDAVAKNVEGSGSVRTAAFAAFGKELDSGMEAINRWAPMASKISSDCDRMVSETDALGKLAGKGNNMKVANEALTAINKSAKMLQTLCNCIMGSQRVVLAGTNAIEAEMSMLDRWLTATYNENGKFDAKGWKEAGKGSNWES